MAYAFFDIFFRVETSAVSSVGVNKQSHGQKEF